MWLVDVIKEFFKAFTAGAEAAKTYAPTDKMKEAKFEIQKPRLSIEAKKDIVRDAKRYLKNPSNRRSTVDSYVNAFIDDAVSDEDKEEIRTELYILFPKRKHIKQ